MFPFCPTHQSKASLSPPKIHSCGKIARPCVTHFHHLAQWRTPPCCRSRPADPFFSRLPSPSLPCSWPPRLPGRTHSTTPFPASVQAPSPETPTPPSPTPTSASTSPKT